MLRLSHTLNHKILEETVIHRIRTVVAKAMLQRDMEFLLLLREIYENLSEEDPKLIFLLIKLWGKHYDLVEEKMSEVRKILNEFEQRLDHDISIDINTETPETTELMTYINLLNEFFARNQTKKRYERILQEIQAIADLYNGKVDIGDENPPRSEDEGLGGRA